MKERLTGAIILVALLVLLVPELLTGPERFTMASKPAGTDGAQLRSYTIDLQDDAAHRQPPPSAPAVAVSDEPVAQATPEPESQALAAAEVTPPVDEAARGTAKPMGSGADASAASPESSGAAKPGAATPPGPSDDKPRSAFGPNAVAAARTPPEKPSTAAKSDAGKSQPSTAAKSDAGKSAASSAAPDTAKADAAKAAAAKAEAQKVEAAKAEAARAEAARADAAKAEAAKAEAAKAQAAKAEAARLAAAKAESSKPAPKPDATRVAAAKPEAAKPAGAKGWAVQLGVFGSRDNAERLAKQVKGSGFPVLINETSGKDGKKLYWVRVGPEAEQSAADTLSAKLKAAGHRDARVVSYP